MFFLQTPVKGYLSIGDDVLLNHWMVRHLDRRKLWIPYGFRKVNFVTRTRLYDWSAWRMYYGRGAFIDVMKDLWRLSEQTISSTDSHFEEKMHRKKLASQFLENYYTNIGREHLLIGGADFFYIPEIMKEQYLMASGIFRSRKCFVELALPAMHLGLASTHDVIYVEGSNLWREGRSHPWSYFNVTHVYLHPFKLMKDAQYGSAGNALFCGIYLRRLAEFVRNRGFDYKNLKVDS